MRAGAGARAGRGERRVCRACYFNTAPRRVPGPARAAAGWAMRVGHVRAASACRSRPAGLRPLQRSCAQTSDTRVQAGFLQVPPWVLCVMYLLNRLTNNPGGERQRDEDGYEAGTASKPSYGYRWPRACTPFLLTQLLCPPNRRRRPWCLLPSP